MASQPSLAAIPSHPDQRLISDPVRLHVITMAWLFAVAHLRGRSGSVRLGGGRWMSRLDMGELLGPAGLYLRGWGLSVGQRTAGV